MDNEQKAKIIYGINPKCTNAQIKKAAYLGLIVPFRGFLGTHDFVLGRKKLYKYHIVTAIFTIIFVLFPFFIMGFDDSSSVTKTENPYFFVATLPFVSPFIVAAILGFTWHVPECINLFRISKNKYPIKNLTLIFCLVVALICTAFFSFLFFNLHK